MNGSIFQPKLFHVFWENLFSLIILNIIFCVVCVPIITIPAAITALCRTVQECMMGNSTTIKFFFHHLRLNLLKSLPLGFFILLGFLGSLYGCLFYYQNSATVTWLLVPSVFCFVLTYIFFCIGVISFQMVARVNLSGISIFKNSVIIVFTEPKLILSWLLIAFALLFAGICLFPHSLPFLVLLLFSLDTWISAYGVLPIIFSQIVKE